MFLATAVITLVLVAVWTQIDWAWSPVDDAGHILNLQQITNDHGWLTGPFVYITELIRTDLTWGLFRPSYWLYPSWFYLLGIDLAHLVRLVMLLVAIMGALAFFRRSGMRGPKLAFAFILLVAAASPLMIGLFLVSLQELSGAAFIGLGLLFRGRWARFISWTIAAWFKSPFAWLLIGQAIVDWRRGRRQLAVANGGVGLVTLIAAFGFSRMGSYSSGYSPLDPYMIWHNLNNLLEPVNLVLLLSAMWWLFVVQGRMSRNDETVVFGVGWLGYTTTLLPWSVTAYYMGPITFLFGLTLVSLLRLPGVTVKPFQALAGFSFPVVLATISVSSALNLGFSINSAMFSLQECLAPRSGSVSQLQGSVLYMTTSPEGAIRLAENLRIANADWDGTVQFRDQPLQGSLDPEVDYLLNAGPPPSQIPPGLEEICGSPSAQVYARTLASTVAQ